ncbi:MAG: hypothetical protein QOJ04_6834 [Caballeronia sp.]|jgi:hypothetical protein|nr:hypothetical protein [Caballeronia sp.]
MTLSFCEPTWDPAFSEAAAEYLQRYFGGWGGLTSSFPCMRDNYPWADHRPDVVDSRIPAKNNTEYHGLETYAAQFHATARYEEASHHWLMAAWCRRIDKNTHGFDDAGHDQAITFCLKNHLFNAALSRWSDSGGGERVPAPEEFGLTEKQCDRLEAKAAEALDRAYEGTKRRQGRKLWSSARFRRQSSVWITVEASNNGQIGSYQLLSPRP